MSSFIPCTFSNPLRWKNGKGRGCFTPEGKFSYGYPGEAKERLNPFKPLPKETQSCRIIIGFKVRGELKIDIEDVISLVKRIRKEQIGKPDSTFLFQRGVYTYTKGPMKGEVEDEPGCQIMILNIFGESEEEFEKNIEYLADELRVRFEQETLIVEFQRGGVQYSIGEVVE